MEMEAAGIATAAAHADRARGESAFNRRGSSFDRRGSTSMDRGGSIDENSGSNDGSDDSSKSPGKERQTELASGKRVDSGSREKSTGNNKSGDQHADGQAKEVAKDLTRDRPLTVAEQKERHRKQAQAEGVARLLAAERAVEDRIARKRARSIEKMRKAAAQKETVQERELAEYRANLMKKEEELRRARIQKEKGRSREESDAGTLGGKRERKGDDADGDESDSGKDSEADVGAARRRRGKSAPAVVRSAKGPDDAAQTEDGEGAKAARVAMLKAGVMEAKAKVGSIPSPPPPPPPPYVRSLAHSCLLVSFLLSPHRLIPPPH